MIPYPRICLKSTDGTQLIRIAKQDIRLLIEVLEANSAHDLLVKISEKALTLQPELNSLHYHTFRVGRTHIALLAIEVDNLANYPIHELKEMVEKILSKTQGWYVFTQLTPTENQDEP